MRRIPRLAAPALLAAAAALAAVPGAGAEVRRITLQGAIDLALAGNRSLADAADGVASSRWTLVAAESDLELKVAPGLGLGLGGGDDREAGPDWRAAVLVSKRLPSGTDLALEPAVGRDAGAWRSSLTASLRQPLLRGAGRETTLAGVASAAYALRSARRARHLREVALVVETVAAAYATVELRELARVREEAAGRLRAHAEAVRVRARAGVAGPIDAFRAELQLKAAEDELAAAREALGDALDRLKILLALPQEREIEIEAPLAYGGIDLGEEEAVRVALEVRVELEQAADTVSEARREARLAERGTLPQLDLALSLTRSGGDGTPGGGLDLDEGGWGVSLLSSTTLGRTAERAAWQRSLLGVGSARRALDLLREEIARQVRGEHRSLRRSLERVGIQEERIRQAEGQLELARVKFSRGLADNFAVLEAEAALARSRADLLAAVSGCVTGGWRLRAAMGTLVDRPETFR